MGTAEIVKGPLKSSDMSMMVCSGEEGESTDIWSCLAALVHCLIIDLVCKLGGSGNNKRRDAVRNSIGQVFTLTLYTLNPAQSRLQFPWAQPSR